MMRDEDKPFVCYRLGWRMKIMPRGGAGWRAFAGWMAILAVLTGLFALGMATLPPGLGQGAAVIAYLGVSLIWAIAMIRWMLARSEIVDLKEMLELKRRNEAGGRKDTRHR